MMVDVCKRIVNIVGFDVKALVELQMSRLYDLLSRYDELGYSLTRARAYWYHGYAKRLRELFAVYGVSHAFDLVHHVERDYHGHLELHELYRQIQITLKIRTVDYVDDYIRLFFYDVIPRHDFLHRVR